MTTQELIELLSNYPTNTEVYFHDGSGCGGEVPIDYVREEHIDNENNYITLDFS